MAGLAFSILSNSLFSVFFPCPLSLSAMGRIYVSLISQLRRVENRARVHIISCHVRIELG